MLNRSTRWYRSCKWFAFGVAFWPLIGSGCSPASDDAKKDPPSTSQDAAERRPAPDIPVGPTVTAPAVQSSRPPEVIEGKDYAIDSSCQLANSHKNEWRYSVYVPQERAERDVCNVAAQQIIDKHFKQNQHHYRYRIVITFWQDKTKIANAAIDDPTDEQRDAVVAQFVLDDYDKTSDLNWFK
jgi:hypothetical protein